MKKIVIVGSGFSGSILARKIAEELDRKVLVVEKRSHIGGNMYDEYDEHGILIQKYGPHFLNTNKYSIIRFLSQYAELFPFAVELLSFVDGKYIRLPFYFETVQQLIGPEKAEDLLSRLRTAFQGRDRVPILELVDHADPEIRAYGSLLFENLLSHPNISVCLNTDALEHLELEEGRVIYDKEPVTCLIYTGAVDELFHRKYGALPYRSLGIRYSTSSENSVLPAQIVSYPQAEGYTRSTEYRKIMYDDSEVRGSVVATEYPLAYDPAAEVGNIPYYPVVTEESTALYQRYLEEASRYGNLFLCGRLAEFKYYNMDVCIEHALAYFEVVRDYLVKL